MKLLLLLALLGGALPTFAQRRWHPYLGIHGSGDAQMYYLGPSIQVGSDYRFNDQYGLTGYLQSYRKRVDRAGTGGYEKGQFSCLTGAALFEVHAGKKANRGMFFAGGLAIQQVEDRFDSSWGGWRTQRTSVLPAIRFGHVFPIRQHYRLSAEINATGPYQKGDEYSRHTELITQLSLGTRLIW